MRSVPSALADGSNTQSVGWPPDPPAYAGGTDLTTPIRAPSNYLSVIALKNSGYVASDWPRYCGRKPKRMMRPLPIVTSTKAALPLMRSPPSNQPERSGSSSRGYQAIIFTGSADALLGSRAPSAGMCSGVPVIGDASSG